MEEASVLVCFQISPFFLALHFSVKLLTVELHDLDSQRNVLLGIFCTMILLQHIWHAVVFKHMLFLSPVKVCYARIISIWLYLYTAHRHQWHPAKMNLACLFNSVTLLLQTCVCQARCMKCFTGTRAAPLTLTIPLPPKVPGWPSLVTRHWSARPHPLPSPGSDPTLPNLLLSHPPQSLSMIPILHPPPHPHPQTKPQQTLLSPVSACGSLGITSLHWVPQIKVAAVTVNQLLPHRLQHPHLPRAILIELLLYLLGLGALLVVSLQAE